VASGNAERMRELVAAFNARNPAATVDALDEYVVFDARELRVAELQRVYQGTAGVAEFWREWLPMWQNLAPEILWIAEVGDHIVMWLRQKHVGRESGAEVTVEYGWDVTFRHGKIIRVSFFNDEDSARRDADLGVG
jgi:SnoaL-like domain